VLYDTRNDYEVKLGTFKGAVVAGIDSFRDFPAAVAKLPAEMKKAEIVSFCTGGIRCEKAAPFMEREGFEHVWQLEGGILKYFEEFPDGGVFEGECFVFDDRIAVTPDLKPTERWGRCPHCGDPASIPTECPYCFENAVICDTCQALITAGETHRKACSRNCATHVKRGTTPRRKPKAVTPTVDNVPG
jgi:predicted sulfurtransferase